MRTKTPSLSQILLTLLIVAGLGFLILYCIAYTPEDSPLYKIRHKEPKNAVRSQIFNNSHYKLLHF